MKRVAQVLNREFPRTGLAGDQSATATLSFQILLIFHSLKVLQFPPSVSEYMLTNKQTFMIKVLLKKYHQIWLSCLETRGYHSKSLICRSRGLSEFKSKIFGGIVAV